MPVISQKNIEQLNKILENNLDKLLEMGFKITYRKIDFIKLYHGGYDLEIELYCSEIRDDYQGVYMSIGRDGKEIKQRKGRNVISNITRFIERTTKE